MRRLDTSIISVGRKLLLRRNLRAYDIRCSLSAMTTTTTLMTSRKELQKNKEFIEFKTLHELQEVACNVSIFVSGLREAMWCRILGEYNAHPSLTRFHVFDFSLSLLKAYSENPLYGTYNEARGQYEYMKYEDFGRKVQECRAVLKNLGKWWF